MGLTFFSCNWSNADILGHEMDVRDLKFEDGAFDVAIDKGTMDAMIKGSLWVSTRYMT